MQFLTTRKLLCALVAAALCAALAGCGAAAESAAAQPTAESTAAEPTAVPTAESTESGESPTLPARLTDALNGCLAFEADSAGGSLKSTIAAAELVSSLAGAEPVADVAEGATAWKATLGQDNLDLLALNWPEVYSIAQAICTDPAAQADQLETAGVSTDFTQVDLTNVPAALEELNGVLGA